MPYVVRQSLTSDVAIRGRVLPNRVGSRADLPLSVSCRSVDLASANDRATHVLRLGPQAR